jgi:molybdopterin converting factor small subunit
MMNQEDILKKVGQILNELQDQYEFLARNPSQLNELELELFLANTNFLSDHVQIVRKINSSKPQKAIQEHTEDQTPVVAGIQEKELEMAKEKTLEELEAAYAAENEQDDIEEESAAVVAPVQTEEKEPEREPLKFEFLLNEEPLTDKFEFEEQPGNAIFDRPLSKQEEEIIAQKQRLRDSQLQQQSTEVVKEEVSAEPVLVADEVEPAPVEEQMPEKVEEKIIAQPAVEPVVDKKTEVPRSLEPELNQVRPTLNDLLAGKSNYSTSLNEESNKTAITDLKQAINLNQKLLYIKDLFNGYNLAYAEAIELINKMPDFKTADNFLQQNYAAKNNWASKQSTVDQFYELLNQRFPSK